jgi:hypothetical protein
VTLKPGNNTVRVNLLNVAFPFLIDKMDVFLKGTSTPTAATPIITPNGGSFSGSVAVSLSTTTSGATIYYTTNGETPTASSTRYIEPFTLTGSATVKAIAIASGFNNSEVASASFTDSSVPTAAIPTISPNGGSFSNPVQVSLSTTTSGATIYYTTNGTVPGTSSTQYTLPFTLTGSATVKAIVVATGYNNSAVASAAFTVTASSQQPYGGVPWAIPGTIEAEDYDTGGEGVAYHDTAAGNSGGLYRMDGVDIWLAANSPEGYYTGANATGEWLEYTVDVAAAGQYQIGFRLCTPNTGRLMHAELDGVNVTGTVNVPNTGSWEVWQTVSALANLSEGQHVLRVAFDLGGFNLNRIVISEMNVSPTAAIPIITPNGGSFSGSVAVSLSTTTSGATIYYTTNGATPTIGSTQYSGPVTLTTNTTVKAYAVATGYNDSAVASAVFTLFQQAGSLTVTISPQGAIDASAQWRVDSASWQASGTTVAGLIVGQHPVEFKAVTGWTTPNSQTVTISNGQTATANGIYVQLQPVLSVSPSNQNVTKEAGTTTFSISNTGTGTMPWTASVTSGSSWLTITSGSNGSNSGTINCNFTANTSTSPRTATIRVTASGATGSPMDVMVTQGSILEELLAASFAGSELWIYNTDIATWTQISQVTPENIIYSGTTLYVDFGVYGLWKLDGTAWTRISPSNSENIVASGSVLYGDFGASGIWMWSGGSETAWTRISPSNSENIVASGSVLYGDFGASGIWMWSGGSETAWTRITQSKPESIVASDSVLYGDFGESGIWMWSGGSETAWTRITQSKPESMVASGSVLYGDFGASGIWMWSGGSELAWTRISPSNSENIVASGSVLYGDFGASGIWMWSGDDELAWTVITPLNPDKMAISN